MLLPPPPKCWNYKYTPLCLTGLCHWLFSSLKAFFPFTPQFQSGLYWGGWGGRGGYNTCYWISPIKCPDSVGLGCWRRSVSNWFPGRAITTVLRAVLQGILLCPLNHFSCANAPRFLAKQNKLSKFLCGHSPE